MNYAHGLVAVGFLVVTAALIDVLGDLLVLFEEHISLGAAWGFLAIVFTVIIFLIGAST